MARESTHSADTGARSSLVLLLPLVVLALLALSLAAPAALAGSGTLAWPVGGVPALSGLDDTPSTAACPDGAGGVIVVSSIPGNGDDLVAQRVAANGSKPWGETPKVVCAADNNQNEFVCTSDGAGGVIVVWKDERNAPSIASVLYAQRLDAAGAAQWTANGTLIDGGADYFGGNTDPRVLADGSGGAIITWLHGGIAPIGMRAQRLNAAGDALWTAGGVHVALADLDGADPADTIVFPGSLAGDGAGGAMVTFVRAPWAAGNAWQRVYVVRVTAGGTVAAAPTAVADVGAPLVHYQSSPQIVYGGDGTAIVAWEDMRHKDEGTPTAYETDIYAQKVRVSDGAVLWAAAGQPLCTAAATQDALHLAPGSPNGAVAVWADHAYDMGSGIYDCPFICANRIDSSGATQWGAASTGGIRVLNVSGAFYQPVGVVHMDACGDGAGGVYIAWPDWRNSVISYSNGSITYSEEAVYGQHVGADGSL